MKIAFSGWIDSGKTTASDYLAQVYEFEQFSFGDALKEELINAGIDPRRLYQVKDGSSRALMQIYGRAMREQDKDHWVKRMLADIDEMEGSYGSDLDIAVDDVRMLNEAEALKERDFILVRLHINGERPGDFDYTETALNDYEGFDYHLYTSRGDLESLYEKLDEIIKEHS
jgi:dephospho-CoA kinase